MNGGGVAGDGIGDRWWQDGDTAQVVPVVTGGSGAGGDWGIAIALRTCVDHMHAALSTAAHTLTYAKYGDVLRAWA